MSVRVSRADVEGDAEPGWYAIGRECDVCHERTFAAGEAPRTPCAPHGDMRVVYRRDDAGSRSRLPHAMRCTKCRTILPL